MYRGPVIDSGSFARPIILNIQYWNRFILISSPTFKNPFFIYLKYFLDVNRFVKMYSSDGDEDIFGDVDKKSSSFEENELSSKEHSMLQSGSTGNISNVELI